jgi:hypothetical protein
MLELKAEHQGEYPVGERSCFGSEPYFSDPLSPARATPRANVLADFFEP